MSCDPPSWFDHVFSQPRLIPYVNAARLDGTHAVDRYQWNLQASEAFHPALSCLEISLRNALQVKLHGLYGRADWWVAAPLRKVDDDKIRRVQADVRIRKGAKASADDIIAELSFGFWVSLLNRTYDRRFWVPALHGAFPHYQGNRRALYDNFDAMRLLRNRIMHHEPIHHRHLEADHAKIYRLLGYMAPDAVVWLKRFDRVPVVLAGRPRP